MSAASELDPEDPEAVVTVARATVTDLVSLMDELNDLTERLRAQVREAEDAHDH